MKKFMIALLAIAVLFGFAACDNSNGTPDTGDDTTGSALINQTVLREIGAKIVELLGSGDYTITSLIGTSQDVKNYSNGTYTVVNNEDKGDPDLDKAPTAVTLTLSSFDSYAEANSPSTKYYLNEFTYEFSAPIMAAADGNAATVSGTLKGYLTLDDTGANEPIMTVTAVDGTPNTVKISTGFGIVMLEEGSISDVTVSNGTTTSEATDEQIEYLMNYLNTNSISITGVQKYDTYYDTAYKAAQAVLQGYAEAIVGTKTDSVIAGSKVTEADGLTYDITVNGTSATIEVVNASENAVTLVKGADEDDEVIQLGSGNSLKIELTGGTAGAANSYQVSNPTAFVVTSAAPLTVGNKAASGDTPDANATFKTINLGAGVSGKLTYASGETWTLTGTSSTTTKNMGTLVGTYALSACTVTGDAPIGPSLENIRATTAPNAVTDTVLTDVAVSYQFPAPAAN